MYRDPSGKWAHVAVDSYGIATDGAGGQHSVCKLVPLPHLGNSVIACRGPLLLLAYVASMAQMHVGDAVEDLTASMPGFIDQAFKLVADHWQDKNLPTAALAEGQEVFCVGWSERAQRIALHVWQKLPGADGFSEIQIEEDAYGLAGPNHPSLEPVTRDLSTAKGMEQLARGQVALFRQIQRPDCGGKLILARVSEIGLSVRTIANLEDAPATDVPRVEIPISMVFGGAREGAVERAVAKAVLPG